MVTETNYAVFGQAKIGGEPMVLRRFSSEAEAVGHALKVKMDHWDDIWVGTIQVEIKTAVPDMPPMPWSVEWCGGYAYIVDADGRKIASLLGSQARRECVAGIICDLRDG